jgi:hypothetical protein
VTPVDPFDLLHGRLGPVEAEAIRSAPSLGRLLHLFRTYNLHNVSY